MKRSYALASLAPLSLLLPSVAAAPPLDRFEPPLGWVASPGSNAVETALSAVFPADRALIAHRYAPVHYQAVDRLGPNGLEGRADYVTRVDFDEDWDARNDWENAAHYPLPGAAYHSVVETKSHWFVVYMFFHPRDWADSLVDTEHENDSEGMLVVIERDGSRFGRVEAAVTVAHSDFYSYVPRGSRFSALRETLDGVLELDEAAGDRPITLQEARGHALKAKQRGQPFEGIVYYPSLEPAEEPGPDDRTALYQLIDVFEAGGLWERRDNPKLFVSEGAFAGDRGGSCGEQSIWCTRNAANAPWGWDDGDDGAVRRGDIATDPLRLVGRYFRAAAPPSATYTWNPYRAPSPALVARAP